MTEQSSIPVEAQAVPDQPVASDKDRIGCGLRQIWSGFDFWLASEKSLARTVWFYAEQSVRPTPAAAAGVPIVTDAMIDAAHALDPCMPREDVRAMLEAAMLAEAWQYRLRRPDASYTNWSPPKAGPCLYETGQELSAGWVYEVRAASPVAPVGAPTEAQQALIDLFRENEIPMSDYNARLCDKIETALLCAQGCELATDATKQQREHSVHLAAPQNDQDFRVDRALSSGSALSQWYEANPPPSMSMCANSTDYWRAMYEHREKEAHALSEEIIRLERRRPASSEAAPSAEGSE